VGLRRAALVWHVREATPRPGRSFAQTWTAFIRIEDGRIAQIHEAHDQQDLNDQLLDTAVPKPW